MLPSKKSAAGKIFFSHCKLIPLVHLIADPNNFITHSHF